MGQGRGRYRAGTGAWDRVGGGTGQGQVHLNRVGGGTGQGQVHLNRVGGGTGQGQVHGTG